MLKPNMSIFLIFFLLVSVNGVLGRNVPNAPLQHTIKSIKSKDGDIIDCVDIHKQPSFQHPSMRNHTIQMAPSSVPTLNGVNTFKEVERIQQSWHESGSSCPVGTVPIIRSTPKVKNLMGNSLDDDEFPPNGQNQKMLDYGDNNINAAVGYVYDTNNGPFSGGSGSISVWQLSVDEREYSKNYVLAADCNGDNSSTLENMDIKNFVAAGWIREREREYSKNYVLAADCNGDNSSTLENMDIKNFVAAGWIVDPDTFGNDHPRLYGEWRAGSNGCYNILCSGFVQVSHNIALGSTFASLSTYNNFHDLHVVEVHVFMDVDSYNWWLRFGDENVGYWPKEIFNNFVQAPAIVFGGEVLNRARNGMHTTTQMGNGHMPSLHDQFGRAGDIDKIVVREKDNNYHDLPLQYFVTIDDCYFYYDGSQDLVGNGRHLYYGGPGGVSCDKMDAYNY